jgi:hypothetical protein
VWFGVLRGLDIFGGLWFKSVEISVVRIHPGSDIRLKLLSALLHILVGDVENMVHGIE